MLVGASATVAPSGFEGNDGNILLGNTLLQPGQLGTEDWANLSPAATRIDDSTSNTDDSLGKGAKEDDEPPTVVSQSVPPKDDFRNVFLATEHIGTSDFLYQSSIRVSPNGSANLNVELNKSSTLSSNGKTPVRTAGDRLITFDFTSGGSTATITTLTWATPTSNPGATCADSNDSLPCWFNQVTLDPTEAEGAANDGLAGRQGAMTAAQNPLTNVALGANTFQEMAINLTAAGILPEGVCETFAVTQIKSRSSGSQGTFNSALKDLVVANRPISNCGSVKIHKQNDAGTALANVKFDLYKDNAPAGGTRGAEDTQTSFTCTTNSSGDCTIANVPLGRYWVVEDPATVPAGHNAAPDQNITITTGGQEVSLTFVNPRQPGSITIHKQDDSANPNPLPGVRFDLYTDNSPFGGAPPHAANDTIVAPALFCVTNASGDCTISNVPLGRYWVVEDPTTVPAGHSAAADQNVNLTTGGQNISLTFTDPRKHRVIVIVCHEGTDTLTTGNVTLDGVGPRGSITAVPQALADKGVNQSDLCSTATGKLAGSGAVFGGLGHGTFQGSVAIPTH
ncbi:MAG: MSCRAMM family protein [Solirubrobacteraceae bacterium]